MCPVQRRMLHSVKLTGVATATSKHCNKAVNVKAKPPPRPDSQPTGISGEPECPAGPCLKQMNWGEEHSPWAPRSLQSLSPYASWGSEGTRQERRKGGGVHLLPNTKPSLSTCPGGSMTTTTDRHTHTYTPLTCQPGP